jgi:hypothetical protein
MKKLKLILVAFSLFMTYISSGQTTLTFRFANPRIVHHTVAGYGVPADADYLDFDIQVKALAAGSYLFSGQANLSFDNTAISTDVNKWVVIAGEQLQGQFNQGGLKDKYVVGWTITGAAPLIFNIQWHANDLSTTQTSYLRFNEVLTSYKTLVTVSAPINDGSRTAGTSFIQASMNGQQAYKLLADPWYAYYNTPNSFELFSFMDTYLGRVYSTTDVTGVGWSQIGGSVEGTPYINWATAVNTSVWDGIAAIPTTGESMMGALRIHNPATLTVPPTGQVTCNNAEINTAQGLVIQSSPAGTGSFIDNGTTTTAGSGTEAVQRDMTADQFHIVSPSVSIADVATFTAGNAVTKIKPYIEMGGGWNLTNQTNGGLIPGYGLLFFRTAANIASTGVASFVGTPAVGDQSINVGRVANGWNCIGNPFTASIKATGTGGLLDVNTSQLDPSYSGVYVWDEQPGYNGTQQNYKVICNAGYSFPGIITTQLSQDYLQVGQGFFVKSKTGGGTIGIPASLRSHQNSIAFKSATVSWPAIRLTAKGTNQSSSTIVTFNSYMSKGLDPTYDVGMLKGNPDFALYSRLIDDNGVDFAVQSLPDLNSGKYIIPVGIDSKDGGNVTFTSETVNIPANMKLTLQDKQTNINTRLDLKDAQYTATIAPGTKGAGRFFLVSEDQLSDSGNQASNNLPKQDDFKVYTIGKTIYIQGEVSPNAKFALYSIEGKLLANFNAGYSNLNQLDGSKFPARTYILTITDNNKRKSIQFILGD